MKIDNDEKITVLLAALSERYTSLHLIRGRVETMGVWIIGLSLAAGGWLLQSSTLQSCLVRVVLIVGNIIALAVLRFVYLADLHRGFVAQQRVAARIEAALGLYTSGVFDTESDAIYPAAWKNAGTEKSGGRFFRSTYLLLYLAASFLTISILASGSL